ncbi:7193_t:CDS:1, partial [Ambispora leptoticha]
LKANYSILRPQHFKHKRTELIEIPIEENQQEILQRILNNLPKTKYTNITSLLKELVNQEYLNRNEKILEIITEIDKILL